MTRVVLSRDHVVEVRYQYGALSHSTTLIISLRRKCIYCFHVLHNNLDECIAAFRFVYFFLQKNLFFRIASTFTRVYVLRIAFFRSLLKQIEFQMLFKKIDSQRTRVKPKFFSAVEKTCRVRGLAPFQNLSNVAALAVASMMQPQQQSQAAPPQQSLLNPGLGAAGIGINHYSDKRL